MRDGFKSKVILKLIRGATKDLCSYPLRETNKMTLLQMKPYFQLSATKE